MATNVTSQERTNILKLVAGMFNAVPGATYLEEFTTSFLALNKDYGALATALGNTGAFKSLYPSSLTVEETATKFLTTLGLAANTEAQDFVQAKLNAGESIASVIVQSLVALVESTSTDPQIVAAQAQLTNKAAVAEYYSVTLGASSDSLATLQGVIAKVTSDAASVEAAKEGSAGSNGQTYMLTKGLDNIPGTAGNDTIIGSVDAAANVELNTLSALDIINGGAGTDTLKVSTTQTTAIPLNNLSNVEIVEVTGTAAVTVDTTATTGVTDLNIVAAAGAINADAGATTNVSVAMKAAGAAVDVDGGNNVTVKLTDVAANTNAVTIGTDTDGGGADLGVAPKGNVVVEMTGKAYTTSAAAVTLSNVTVTGGKTVSVTQKAAADIAAAAADTTNTGNGVTQGTITVNGNADTTAVTVKQDATVAAVNAANKTGGVTETVSFKFSAMTAGQTVIIGGLTFTAAKDLTKEQAATAFANLAVGIVPAGGPTLTAGDTQGSGVVANGVYTGALTGWTTGAASGDTVTFTSTTANTSMGGLTNTGTATAVPTISAGKAHDAGATGGVMGVTAGAVSVVDNNATIKTITVDGVGTGSTTTTTSVLETLNVSNQAAGATFVVADSAATLALNLEKVGTTAGDAVLTITSAPATLNVKSTGNNYVNLTAALTENLNVSGTGTLKASATDLAALKTVKVTESAGLSLNAGVADTVTSVDTTGTTGAVEVTIDGTKATYAGGAGKDTVNLSNTTAVSKVIDLGAGDDTLKLGTDTTAVPTETLKGGEGTDTLSMTTASAVSFGGATTFAGKLSSFERLTINNAAGTADGVTDTVAVNVENLGFNYVTTTGTNTGSSGARDILKLDNLANNSTVVLTANGHVQANIKNATDVANTSDVLNAIARVDDAGVTHGTLTAAGVETINLTAEDISPVSAAGAKTISKSTLTLAADKATTINLGTSNADLDLTLTAATNKVTLIDGANMTGNLKVQAAGGVATTIKGGSGADVLTASSTAGSSTINATGASASVKADGTAGSTLGKNAIAEVQTLAITADDAHNADEALAITYSIGTGAGTTATTAPIVLSNSANQATVIAEVVAALNLDATFSPLATASVGAGADVGKVVITYKAAGVDYGSDVLAVAAGTTNTLAGAGFEKTAGAAAIAEVTTVTLTDGTVNGGLSLGDTMSLTVGGKVFTYTADATKTMDQAGQALADLIAADTALVTSATYTAGSDLITITAKTAGAAGLGVTGYAVVDASATALGDTLNGGAGNDILVANAGLSKLTGGEGNDLFVVGTASLNVNSYSTVEDFQAGDLLQMSGAVAFKSAKVDLGDTAVFQDLANAAVASLGIGEAGWFQVGGNTYVVMDVGANSTSTFINGEDFIVKLTGLVDLTNASFNNTHDTIALV